MKIVTAAEMREIDRVTSERFGVPSLTLMENAGTAVADFLISQYPSAKRFGIICGKGNNGGDGFVTARKLHEAGKDVRVLLLAERAELRGDAAEMFTKLPVAPVTVSTHEQLKTEAARAVFDADVLVDAILGTGFRPPVSGLYAEAIAALNASTAPVVAVDIPSGADADVRGEQVGAVARADAVVTFTAPRPAHVFGMLTHGPTIISPIGSPDEAVVSSLNLNLITARDIAPLIGPRLGCGEQRKLRPCAGPGWIDGQGRSRRHGGYGSVAVGRGIVIGGHREISSGDGGRLPSRTDDRASGRNRCRQHFDARTAARENGFSG